MEGVNELHPRQYQDKAHYERAENAPVEYPRLVLGRNSAKFGEIKQMIKISFDLRPNQGLFTLQNLLKINPRIHGRPNFIITVASLPINLLNFNYMIDLGQNFWLKDKTPIGQSSTYQSLGAFISAVLPNVYVVAGIILFFLMIFGGITYIKNAGSGDEEGIKKGQQALTAALIGFLIIFLSYWIIQLIEIITGLKIFGSNL